MTDTATGQKAALAVFFAYQRPLNGEQRMAKGRDLTPFQRGIIKRYYEHKDTLMAQKLGEIVSDLSVCEDKKRSGRLWERARKALLNLGANKLETDNVCGKRDLEWLAELVGELF